MISPVILYAGRSQSREPTYIVAVSPRFSERFSDLHCQNSTGVGCWQCLFREWLLAFPRFFLGLSRFDMGLSRFAAAFFRFSLADSQRPSGGGHVATERGSLAISQKEMVLGLMRFVATAIDLLRSYP